MAKVRITKVEVKIAEPKVQQITAQSNPAIWAILQPPTDNEKRFGRNWDTGRFYKMMERAYQEGRTTETEWLAYAAAYAAVSCRKA